MRYVLLIALICSVQDFGQALFSFHGEEFFVLEDTPSLDLEFMLTIEIVFQFTEDRFQHSLVEKYGCKRQEDGFYLRLVSEKVCFGVVQNCNSISELCSDIKLKNNTQYHIGVTLYHYKLWIFVNGYPSLKTAFPRAKDAFKELSQPLLKGHSPLIVGARAVDHKERFVGVMKEFRLWSVARSAEYMKEAMHLDITGNESGLIGYWKFKPRHECISLNGECVIEDISSSKNHLRLRYPLSNLENEIWKYSPVHNVATNITSRTCNGSKVLVTDSMTHLVVNITEQFTVPTLFQVCCTALVHNTSGLVQLAADAILESNDTLKDHVITFSSEKQDVWQKECMIIDSIFYIKSMLLSLIIENSTPTVQQSHTCCTGAAPCAMFKDINIKVQQDLQLQDRLDNLIYDPLPELADTFAVSPNYSIAEYQPTLMDVTLIVDLPSSNLKMLSSLAKMYDGPISAAIYVQSPKQVESISEYIMRDERIRKYVSIHLVYQLQTDELYPMAYLRKIATENAQTRLVTSHADFDSLDSLVMVLL